MHDKIKNFEIRQAKMEAKAKQLRSMIDQELSKQKSDIEERIKKAQ